MTTTGASSVRSFNGCWTCRLRRKKCDENQPACSTCISLELQCDGFGAKPTWMDNGPLQKEQASRVKRAVSKTKSKRQKQRMLRLGSPLTNLGIEELSGTLDTSYNYPSENSPFDGTNWATESTEAGAMDLAVFDKNIASSFSQDNIFIMESFFNDDGLVDGFSDNEDLSGKQDLEPSGASNEPQVSGAESLPTPNTFTVQDPTLEMSRGLSKEAIHIENTLPGVESPWNSYATPTKSFDANKIERYFPFLVHPQEAILDTEMEDGLLMNYLDEVFYIQYPFYNTKRKQLRGWLFSTLRREKSVYHATLALSEHHMKSTVARSVLLQLSSRPSYYGMALQELELGIEESRSQNNSPSLVRSVECLTCLLQILFFEIFSGGTGNWQPYLSKAATLISPVVEAVSKPVGQNSTGREHGTQPQLERDRYFGYDIGLNVLLGSFLSFDIIACASTRSPPSLKLDHKHILENGSIDLEGLFGCANAIMILIFEIVILDNWKRGAQKNRQLSMLTLVKRAAHIEERLQREIKDLETMKSQRSHSLEGPGGSSSSAHHYEVSRIFAFAALTYLHVVISGANPELPDIAESVSKTVAAFKSLSDQQLLRNTVWPFCVSGCLASEEQQDFFVDLISKAQIDSSTLGTCFQAFKLVQECWKVRKTSFYNCDWASIMNRRGYNMILF